MEGMASRTLKAGLINANIVPTSSARLVATLQETNHGHAGWRAEMIIRALELVKKYDSQHGDTPHHKFLQSCRWSGKTCVPASGSVRKRSDVATRLADAERG